MTGTKSERKYHNCPRCGGVLYIDNDGYEDFFNCMDCSREFDLDMIPRRMSTIELKTRKGIKLTSAENHARLRIE